MPDIGNVLSSPAQTGLDGSVKIFELHSRPTAKAFDNTRVFAWSNVHILGRTKVQSPATVDVLTNQHVYSLIAVILPAKLIRASRVLPSSPFPLS